MGIAIFLLFFVSSSIPPHIHWAPPQKGAWPVARAACRVQAHEGMKKRKDNNHILGDNREATILRGA